MGPPVGLSRVSRRQFRGTVPAIYLLKSRAWEEVDRYQPY